MKVAIVHCVPKGSSWCAPCLQDALHSYVLLASSRTVAVPLKGSNNDDAKDAEENNERQQDLFLLDFKFFIWRQRASQISYRLHKERIVVVVFTGH